MVLPFMKVAVSQLFSKPSCEMYPFVPKEAAPHYRGRIAYDADKCIGCGLCTRVCDGEAITIVKEPVEGGENITLTFNLGTCTFCANWWLPAGIIGIPLFLRKLCGFLPQGLHRTYRRLPYGSHEGRRSACKRQPFPGEEKTGAKACSCSENCS